MNILLVDDDQDCRGSVAEFLNELGHQVTEASNGLEALRLYSSKDFSMILSDIKMPMMDGLELLKEVNQLEQVEQTDVVLFTGYGDMESAIGALREGAYDYLLKPIDIDELAIITARICEHQALERENQLHNNNFSEVQETEEELSRLKKIVAKSSSLNELCLFSDAMCEISQLALKYHQDRSIPILIEGETGTGKELIARLIHHGSTVGEDPFIDVNCAAITSNLFESELFGYEAGAFTGGLAKGNKGKLDLAQKGTIFLDEVAEIPLEMQGKLLRVLQEREYYRVGGLKKIQADVRFVFATNSSLEEQVKLGKFRRDLYYRLKVGYIVIPPLRERVGAITPLAQKFLEQFSLQRGKQFRTIDPEASVILENYDWPGNVRELRNLVDWITFMYDDRDLQPCHLGRLKDIKSKSFEQMQDSGINVLEDFELPTDHFPLKDFINTIVSKALKLSKGNKMATARYLGITRRELYSRLKHIKVE